MSGVKDFGLHGGFVSIGEVVNADDDPTQSGLVRVKWQTGSAVQDQISDDDLPWTRTMHSSTNPSLGQTGGPHTGLRKGSRVVGIPLDGTGQEFLVIGSIVRSGTGGPDQQSTIDSDIPQPAKVEQNGGERQPRHGDVNGVVAQTSIVEYAQERGGTGQPGKYCSIDDSIGTLDRIIA